MMPRLKLKKISKKKKIKYLFLLLVSYLVFAYTFYYSFNLPNFFGSYANNFNI